MAHLQAASSSLHISTTISDSSRNDLIENPKLDVPTLATIPPDGGRAAWLTIAGAYVLLAPLQSNPAQVPYSRLIPPLDG